MDWTKATDTQLLTIAKTDHDCPTTLLSGVVEEMLNRNLFDPLIVSIVNNVMKIDVVEKLHKVSLEDFLQIGRVEIWKGVKRFKPGHNKAFISFVYMTIKHEFIKQINALEALKRDNRQSISYQTKELREIDFFLKDKKTNVERYVINKVTIEQLIKRVNRHQRNVIDCYMMGYTFEEIASILGRGTFKTINRSFWDAVKKMRKGA